MAAARMYIAEDALTVTAFPLSDNTGYVVRVGDRDHDGVYLGAVFHTADGWVAHAPPNEDGSSELLGSSIDLDELMTDCFLRRMRLTDELGW
ncbi:hypothetical protein [Agromyces sp. Marseille-Q5079]|uniref:hypothetical protein n=1 Tax=Agromyces sp. Marseille-Q5079 TaxID=3439059 RepID=UPI003D9C7D2E